MMTRQEIFNKAWTHAKTMKALAKENIIGCMCYMRAPNGEKCLIGGLIPDDKYIKRMELAFSDLYVDAICRAVLDELGLTTPHQSYDFSFDEENEELTFFERLQSCHDAADTLEEMFDNLENFANRYGLNIPEMT